jgi:hypothetical protein
MNTVFDAPIVPSYAAELSDSDSDVDASDEEMDATAKRPRTTDAATTAADDASSTGPLPAAKRARTGAPPSLAHSPTVAVTALPLPCSSVVAAVSERSDSSDSDDEEASDDGDDETSHSQAAPLVPEVSTMERCIKQYVFKVEARMRDRRVRQSWQQIVDEARRAIQYEIDNKPAVWKEGIGRASSYLAMMKALLNVSTVRSVNRKMMLEVIEQAGEVLDERWGGE